MRVSAFHPSFIINLRTSFDREDQHKKVIIKHAESQDLIDRKRKRLLHFHPQTWTVRPLIDEVKEPQAGLVMPVIDIDIEQESLRRCLLMSEVEPIARSVLEAPLILNGSTSYTLYAYSLLLQIHLS